MPEIDSAGISFIQWLTVAPLLPVLSGRFSPAAGVLLLQGARLTQAAEALFADHQMIKNFHTQ